MSSFYSFLTCCFTKALISLAVVPAFLLPFEQTVWATENIRLATGSEHNNIAASDSSSTSGTSPAILARTWQVYRLPHPSQLAVSPLTQLPVLADGASALPSNASNFHGAMNASVDPRTGSASFSMPVASVLYDQGQGKRDLTLSYRGGASALGPDPLGLGPHWTLNVGTEHPSTSEVAGHKTTDITTGDGHSFTMESDRNSQGQSVWHPLRHKLGDVKITGEPGNWTIAVVTGIREHLLHGYEDWEEGRDGQRIWFYYDRNGPADSTRHLHYVCANPLTDTQVHGTTNACPDNGVWLTYQGDKVTVHGQQTVVLHTFDVVGAPMVKSVSMPPLSSTGVSNSNQSTEVRFAYDTNGNRPWLLQQVSEPSGWEETFHYNEESGHSTLQPQGLPTGLSDVRIPVVSEQISTPPTAIRQTIPVKHLWYQYSGGTGDQHNYTGYQAGVSAAPGKDNLLDRSDNYTYTVAQDNGFTTTRTLYNKYHLPLSITQQDDLHHATVAVNEAIYSRWKGTTFAELPPTYSFPTQSSKTLYALTSGGSDDAVTPAKVVQKKQYDMDGQVIWQQDAYGREVFTQYCPPEGDSHCPAMDPNWPQVTLPEKVLQLPATHSPAGSVPFQTLAVTGDPAPAVEVVYNYTLLPVAQRYQQQVEIYRQQLLQQARGQSPMLNTMVMKNTVGLDTSEHSGNWQVVTKTVGTLSPASVAELKPGAALPELTATQTSIQTHYQYNRQQTSPTYGQLMQLTVTRTADTNFHHWVSGRLLQLAAAPASADKAKETVTINVHHTLDPDTHTRTTTMAVAPGTPPADIQGEMVQLGATEGAVDSGDGGLSLGTAVYSLVSGVKLASEDTLKSLHTAWTYDIWNRPVKEVITPASGERAQTITWTYINTQEEQAVVKTTPDGNQQKVVYTGSDKNQLILSTWHRFKLQVSAAIEGPSNWIPDSKTLYTEAGKPASKTGYHAADPDGNQPGKTIGLTTTYGYDTLNRLVWKKGTDGLIKVVVRNDPAMWLIGYQVATGKNRQGEKLGPVLKVVQSNKLGKPEEQYTFGLDPALKVNGKALYSSALQRQLQTLEAGLKPADTLRTTQSYGLLPLAGGGGLMAFIRAAIAARAWFSRTSTTYDGNGRRIAQTQPNGATTRWEWQHGNLVATIAPDGSMIHDTFNIMGKKIARCVQPAGSNTCHTLGRRGYDDEGNLAWQEDEHGRRITYAYDADGRLFSMTTPATEDAPKGHTFTYTYNSIGKTVAAIDGTPYAKYTYAPDTWQLTDQEDRISHLHYSYDSATGWLIKITRSVPTDFKAPAGIHYPTGTETLRYDRYGQPVQLTDLAGNTFITQHDTLGRPLQNTTTLPGQKKATLLTAMSYGAYFNRPVQVTNGLGITRTFTYNSLGQIAGTTDRQGNTALQTLAYIYDQTNNITTLTRTEGSISATQAYTYDKNTNSLIAMTCTAAGDKNTPSLLCPRDTDLASSDQVKPPIILSQQYAFDDWHNISSVTEQAVTSSGKESTKVTRYTYATASKSAVGDGNADNPAPTDRYDPHQMVAFSRQWQDSGKSEAPQTLTYDTSGRIIKDADGNTLHYNAFGQQDGFTDQQTKEHTTYTYNSRGHQIAEQPFTAQGQALQTPLYMVYQGNTITAQVQDDKNHHAHTSVELGGVAHSEDGVINRWYLHDYKGDVLSTFNARGQRTGDHVYSPYGMDYDLLSAQTQALPARLNLSSQSPWWQSHQPGFDNQMTDPATGYQFLGGGYRAYNPVYRHFMSHDSYSPFKTIDGYGFGSNNPIMNTDPTGHMPKWLSYTLGGLGIAMAVFSAILLPVAAAGAAAATGVAVGATGVVASTAVTSTSMGAIGVASGSLQIAGTAHPENRKLAIANTAFGVANGISTIVMGTMTAGAGVADAAAGIGKMTSALIITSGVSGALSGVTDEASSDMGAASLINPDLAEKAGWDKALNVLGYVSLGLMAVSVASGIGAGVDYGRSRLTTGKASESEGASLSTVNREPAFDEEVSAASSKELDDAIENLTAALDEAIAAPSGATPQESALPEEVTVSPSPLEAKAGAPSQRNIRVLIQEVNADEEGSDLILMMRENEYFRADKNSLDDLGSSQSKAFDLIEKKAIAYLEKLYRTDAPHRGYNVVSRNVMKESEFNTAGAKEGVIRAGGGKSLWESGGVILAPDSGGM